MDCGIVFVSFSDSQITQVHDHKFFGVAAAPILNTRKLTGIKCNGKLIVNNKYLYTLSVYVVQLLCLRVAQQLYRKLNLFFS